MHLAAAAAGPIRPWFFVVMGVWVFFMIVIAVVRSRSRDKNRNREPQL